jgi:hypothetical protein
VVSAVPWAPAPQPAATSAAMTRESRVRM